MNVKSAIFAFPFLVILAVTVSAEEDSRFESYNYRAITEIKGEVTQLLSENQQLKQEHNILQEQLNALMLIRQDKQTQVKELADKTGAFWMQNESQSYDKALEGNFLNLEKDLASQNARLNYMNSELMDLDERHRLWKLYLADLEYQKRELQLKLKLKEAEAIENNRDRAEDISRIRREIMTTREKHQRLKAEIGRLDQTVDGVTTQAKKLLTENKALEQQNMVLERRVDIRYSENQLVRDKIAYTKKLKEAPVLDQLKEKNTLEDEVARLEKDYEQLNRALVSSWNQQQMERKLINNVMAIDKANQGLKEKIENLRKELEISP
ncbi:MAG: hypothetical protein KC618_08190 [Candidatus Omnitrophica bacterium]|nr:hypothetical protein [Candidatus Omnitrophota bacterium]